MKRSHPPEAPELTRMLMEEWTKPRTKGQPLIVLEGKKGEPLHIYVIWDAWKGLSQQERSEIIMDVVENLTGENAFRDLSLVTVAMGLTAEEAKRMHIEAA
jgi:hypothetical protein